ncbi:hypothetical protein BD311DRAFT_492697 [Dichomitus squalens]|uniref:Uncharacterized protein n=1 Tax=Dichomitus squalens TaxID=114155 RepID=A0A4Q9MHF8_9APHY|nr:hypothetical protein BD311DRAFT_492697 [Dichomitus squalens]
MPSSAWPRTSDVPLDPGSDCPSRGPVVCPKSRPRPIIFKAVVKLKNNKGAQFLSVAHVAARLMGAYTRLLESAFGRPPSEYRALSPRFAQPLHEPTGVHYWVADGV